jgi:hypothetical protein
MLASARAPQLPDNRISQSIAPVELTERLTETTLASLSRDQGERTNFARHVWVVLVRSALFLALARLTVACPPQELPPQEQEFPPPEGVARFGTTVVIPSGLRGEIYTIPRKTRKLPNLEKLKPVGTIYTTILNVPVSDFTEGFPGVTGQFEWFAIDYTGRFWIEKPGYYRFALLSDDGSKLYIDGVLVIDNDGLHSAQIRAAKARLSGGIHSVRVSYFQGPRYELALVLAVAGPGEHWRIFSTDEFRPPANPKDWRYHRKGELDEPPNPKR